MKDFIGIYDNIGSPEYCEDFINFFKYLTSSSIALKEDTPPHKRELVSANLAYMSTLGYNMSFKEAGPVGLEFLPLVNECISEYVSEYSILTNNNFLLFDLKVKKFPLGGGFHDWHYETMDRFSTSRSFVVQMYLNTIEEGGETEFLYINKRVKAKQGRVVIFPAGYTHTHRGNPPIGNDKYLITSWGLLQE